MTETIWLQRPSEDVPWGFRLNGGIDCSKPLTVQRVSPGSIASTGLQTDDVILKIGENETSGLTQAQSQDIIKTSGNILQLTVAKHGGSGGVTSPGPAPGTPQTPVTPPQTQPPPPMAPPMPPPMPPQDQPKVYHTPQPSYHHANGPPAPPPAPPAPTQAPWSAPSGFANRLEEQLANMSVNNYQPPTYSYDTDASYSSPPAPGAPGPMRSNSTPAGPTQGSAPTTPYAGGGPGGSQPHTPVNQMTGGPKFNGSVPARDQQQVPDAILNMAAKGPPEKKPWAYAPDMNSIQQQRERVRRRGKEPTTPEAAPTRPHAAIPRYQHMLNLPSFDDKPVRQHHKTPPTSPESAAPGGTAGEGGEEGEVENVLVEHAQFNSPLQLYSEENAQEAFALQAQGSDTAPVKLARQSSNSSNKDVTMSPVYRMIHGLDEEKPKFPRASHAPSAQPRGVQAPREDEQTFTSLNSTGKIPSKSFQRLQQFTDQAPPPTGSPQGSVDTSSIRHTLNPQDEADGGIGDYAQASIRYMGRNIPSKSFRMLQNLTGGPDNTPAPARQPRRQRRPVEQPAPDTNPDEGVDISYVGGNIPSKTFQLLQCSMGEEPAMPPEHYAPAPLDQTNAASAHGTHAPRSQAPHSAHGNPGQRLQTNQGRTVKVISLRQPPRPQREDGPVTEF